MIAKFAKILRVTGVKTGAGVLIFDVNRSRIGIGVSKKRLRTSLVRGFIDKFAFEAPSLELEASTRWRRLPGVMQFTKRRSVASKGLFRVYAQSRKSVQHFEDRNR